MKAAPVEITEPFIDLGDLRTRGQRLEVRLDFAGGYRRGSQIKCLYFDRSGFCIWGKKRLETGKFISDWRTVRTREMDWTDLKLLLEGLAGKRVRKRFSLPSVVTTSL